MGEGATFSKRSINHPIRISCKIWEGISISLPINEMNELNNVMDCIDLYN
jgi:hypothetical protein